MFLVSHTQCCSPAHSVDQGNEPTECIAHDELPENVREHTQVDCIIVIEGAEKQEQLLPCMPQLANVYQTRSKANLILKLYVCTITANCRTPNSSLVTATVQTLV